MNTSKLNIQDSNKVDNVYHITFPKNTSSMLLNSSYVRALNPEHAYKQWASYHSLPLNKLKDLNKITCRGEYNKIPIKVIDLGKVTTTKNLLLRNIII